MPYVPPPHHGAPRTSSGFVYEFAVRYFPVEVTMFNSMTLSTPGELSGNLKSGNQDVILPRP